MGNDCKHENFAAHVGVHRLGDDGGAIRNYVAEITVRCTQCDQPFHFLGPGAGYSFKHPTVNVGATTLHAPIAPGVGPLPSSMRFDLSEGST